MPRQKKDLKGKPGKLSARPWMRLRAHVLNKQPLCVKCLAEGRTVAATEVDHIIPRKLAPELTYDEGNLQPLCGPHHTEKTAEDMMGKKRALTRQILTLTPNHRSDR